MSKLQDLCYRTIADIVQTAPPMLQEAITQKTTEQIKQSVRDDVKAEITPEVIETVEENFSCFLEKAVPAIMKNMIDRMVNENHPLMNVKEKYRGVNPTMIECAVKIAENAVYRLETHYVNRALSQSYSGNGSVSNNDFTADFNYRGIPTRGFDRVEEDSYQYEESGDETSTLDEDDTY
jgi:uncharacterized membrane-anchored protein YjiN (DUF445 family)